MDFLTAICLWPLIGCWFNVLSAEVTITRDTNDLIQFSNCSGSVREFCNEYNADPFVNYPSLCNCQCRQDYVMYRDPGVNRTFGYDLDTSKCVWYGTNHEGCTRFKIAGQDRVRRPVIIDLSSTGRVSGLVSGNDDGCLDVDPYIKYPGGNEWFRVNINFTLRKISEGNYELQWQPDSSNRYNYQGLAMRLDVCGRNRNYNCIMTKVAGTYTDPKKCTQRTTDGRCCVFPFLLNRKIYNSCSDDKGFEEKPWCPVSLKFNADPTNRSFRAVCADITSSTASPLLSTNSHSASVTTHQFPAEIFPSSTATSSQISSSVTAGGRSSLGSCDSTASLGLILGIVVGLLVLLIIAVVVVFCLCRRKAKKNINKKSIGTRNDGFLEASYDTVADNSPKTVDRSSDEAFSKCSRKNLSSSVPAKIKSSNTHFYDTVTENVPEFQPAPVYNMPEADYSLIATLPRKTKTENRPSLPINDPLNHVYSVLERDNDPLRNPEPVDNDVAFVEANPVYSTNSEQNAAQSQHEQIYEEPSETISSMNV